MNIDPDDPNLTAYALGELSGPEATRIEKIVASSPEAEAFVAETRELARLLEKDFAADLESGARTRPSLPSARARDNLWWDSRWMSIRVAALIAICALIAGLIISVIELSGPTSKMKSETRQAEATDHSIQMEMSGNPVVEGEPQSADQTSRGSDKQRYAEDGFVLTTNEPTSSFLINVDSSSYDNVRRLIESGKRPPPDIVQIEALVNHFKYDYPQSQADQSLSINLEAATCPWTADHRLVRIGLRARETQRIDASNTLAAKDARVAVRFNSGKVASYRLLGYENRSRAHPDGNRGPGEEILAGHTVTALYEIVPAKPTAAISSGELLTVDVKYKSPDRDDTETVQQSLFDSGVEFNRASADFRFAAAVVRLGMILRGSLNTTNATIDDVIQWAQPRQDTGQLDSRAEFVDLARKAKALRF